MHITQLQCKILGAMRDKPIRGEDLKRACNYCGSNRAFANALLRMIDKNLITMATITPGITYVASQLGCDNLPALSPDKRGEG